MGKILHFRHRFRYRNGKDEYDYQMKKPFPWLLLLLLILLLVLLFFLLKDWGSAKLLGIPISRPALEKPAKPEGPVDGAVVVRCSDVEANNGDSSRGDHCVGEHSLGKPGRFVFKFYTDSEADIIHVYDGSSADMAAGKAPLLYTFGDDGEVTDTIDYRDPRFHISLKSDSGVVTVVVDNGTNWGYIVTCPA